MSANHNPFANRAPAGTTSRRAQLWPWAVAAAFALASVGLWLWSDHQQAALRQETEVLRHSIKQATADLARAVAARQTNDLSIAALQQEVAALRAEKQLASQMQRSLEDEMRAKLESKDVTIAQLQGKLTVTIVDRVMFDSGEATLKPEGEAVMQKIAALLAGHPELKIHVVGHTDNVPIKPAATGRFASNWELSTARALAAVHCLVDQAGVDPRRVGAVGYGEFRPIADNNTPEGRARNRRIVITILPDELAPTDPRGP
jgi:chemotaxis protein MotB